MELELMTINLRKRLIARLDIKGPNLIKGVHLEGLKVVGEPALYAKKYYDDGIDELLYNDVVASLYGRNHLSNIIEKAAGDIFVPLTVGGGVRSVKDVELILKCGGDKVSINTAAVHRPSLICEIVKEFGSQVLVLSVEALRIANNLWSVMTDNGRERTNLHVVDWVRQAEDCGVGEILLTSIDQEGTTSGFDITLLSTVSSLVSIPVIASGGFGQPKHALQAFNKTNISAIAIAHSFHYKKHTIADVRKYLQSHGVDLRDA